MHQAVMTSVYSPAATPGRRAKEELRLQEDTALGQVSPADLPPGSSEIGRDHQHDTVTVVCQACQATLIDD